MTPINPPKKSKPVRWQFGIRSRNAPWEALLSIHKSLHKLGATYIPDEDYEQAHAKGSEGAPSTEGSFVNDYDAASSARGSSSSMDPAKRYKLPADPWHIKVRWDSRTLEKHHKKHSKGNDAAETQQPDSVSSGFVALHLDIQIYEMDQQVYLVDFKCSGYETAQGRLLDEKDVTSPFPFLDMAAKLIMQLAEAD
jgi:carbon catabolite-derepressing protein kinase